MAAYKTAIRRKTLSRPAALHKDNGSLVGRVLDYGCGRGDDARSLGCESYDPHWNPVELTGQFTTIMCNYVLNVIEDSAERRGVLNALNHLLTDYGCAFIAVRADKKALNGYTKTGTWQGYIELDLPVVFKGPGYVIYRMDKGQNTCEIKATTFDK